MKRRRTKDGGERGEKKEGKGGRGVEKKEKHAAVGQGGAFNTRERQTANIHKVSEGRRQNVYGRKGD